MKLMKHITIALVLCAIPAMAFAQTAGCTDCNHTVSYYKGTGGLIATADDDAEMVGFVASCGGTTRTGELTPNDDGVVSMLLTGDYACDADEGSFDIGPITDGGWYWINDEDNSAIGNLVAKDTLDNMATELTGAGDGVTMMAGNGAVFVKETATGRVGILPNILPNPPAAPATICGAYKRADGAVAQTTSGCMLGDGSTMVRILFAGQFGRIDHAVGSASVYRNTRGAGSVTVDLWTTGGIVSTGDTPIGTGYVGLNVGLGLASGSDGVSAKVGGFDASLAGALGSGNENLTVTDGDSATSSDRVTITFEDATTSIYCTATSSTDAVLSIKLVSDQAGVLPKVKDLNPRDSYHGAATVTIKCPPPAANMGTDLVPDNPFPTDA